MFRTMLLAAAGAAVITLGPIVPHAVAAPGSFEVQLKNRLVQQGLDKRIYQDLFRRAMPAGTALSSVSVRGKLSTLGISYNIPGSGLPLVPAVGDEQTIENCGFEAVESNVTLGAEVHNTASWSREDSLAKAFETSVEIEVSYSSPFGLSASAKTGFSYGETRTSTTGQAKSIEKVQSYSLAKTVYTKPGTISKAQLVYAEKTANNIGYAATYQCSGKTVVTFTQRNPTPKNEVLVGLSGKCLDVRGENRNRGAGLILYDCHGHENQRWTYNASTREIRGLANHCLDVAGGHSNNGTPIIMWPCHGGANQKWTITSNGEIKGLDGKCLDVSGSNSNNSTPIILWPCHGGANQKWTTRTSTVSGSVDIEKYLNQAARTITVKGSFNGLYSSNASSFRVADAPLSDAYCEKVRDQLGIVARGMSARSAPKVAISRSLPKPGSAVAMTAKTVKGKRAAYVVVRKPSAAELKKAKPLPSTKAVK